MRRYGFGDDKNRSYRVTGPFSLRSLRSLGLRHSGSASLRRRRKWPGRLDESAPKNKRPVLGRKTFVDFLILSSNRFNLNDL